MYLSSSFRYKDKRSVYSYEVKDVQFKYKEISNNNCIISKMVAKMAAENLILMFLSSAFRYKNKWSVYSFEVKDVEFRYVEIK